MIVVAAYVVITCMWWLLTLTVGLPLSVVLLFNKSFRSSFFSWGYYRLAEPFFKTHLDIARKKTFQVLKDNLKDKSRPLEVLEIGVGQGPNLRFYPENCHLTVLDKNGGFESYFLKNLKKFPHISYRRTVIQPAENMAEIADESFDVVISTYLHCSTDDSKAVLEEVKRVLKAGGKYLFLDHVCFPKGDVGLYVQKFAGPLWCLFSDGCVMHRDVERTIKRAGFSEVICNKLIFKNFSMYYLKHQISGIATK